VAAKLVGSIYYWGQGVAIDYVRSMAAYKVAGEGGDAGCQYQVGFAYCNGQGVDVDYAQALPWIEKAAAQDYPSAVGQLGGMYFKGKGVTPSWRRAREYYGRAIELGNSTAVKDMEILTENIQQVTSQRPPLHRSCATSRSHALYVVSHTRRPSWTSGWRSTARAART